MKDVKEVSFLTSTGLLRDIQKLKKRLLEISDLLFQLNRRENIVSNDIFLKAILADNSFFSFAFVEGKIVGIAQVLLCRTLTGTKISVENVVVDVRYQKQGIGIGMMQHLNNQLELSEKEEADAEWFLTNSPERETSGFYKRYGFKECRTNVYKVKHTHNDFVRSISK